MLSKNNGYLGNYSHVDDVRVPADVDLALRLTGEPGALDDDDGPGLVMFKLQIFGRLYHDFPKRFGVGRFHRQVDDALGGTRLTIVECLLPPPGPFTR